MILLSADIGLVTNGISIYDLSDNKLLKYFDFFSRQKKIEDKLNNIYDIYTKTFSQYRPSCYIYEEPCIVNRGVNGTLVPQALGVMKLVAKQHDSNIFSYSPKFVKKKVTGDGNAIKSVIAKSVSEYFDINNKFTSDHVSDSLAVLICYLLDTNQ